MTDSRVGTAHGTKSVEANLWGSALVFSCLCLLSRVGRTAALFDWLDNITVVLYLLGWVGPIAALGMCITTRRRPWPGAIVPIAVHIASGLVYAGIGWN